MNKKLGPLELWQWLAAGAAIGLVLYLRGRSKAAATPAPVDLSSLPASATGQGATAGQTSGATDSGAGGSIAGMGPIDPSTGLPYLQELLSNQQQTQAGIGQSQQDQLGQEIGNIGSLLGILSQIQGVQQAGPQLNQTTPIPPSVTTQPGLPTPPRTGARKNGPKLPANPKSGGHYVSVHGKPVLIHYAGGGKWSPGPPPRKPTRGTGGLGKKVAQK